MNGPTDAPLIFLVAGEPSGDQLGARLMAAIEERRRVRFAGVGGPLMEARGLSSLFPMAELSVMGLVEVVPHLPKLIRRLSLTVAAVRESRPAVLVTIDSPGFNFRLARRLKGAGIPIVHYVAPSVWAWRPGRARAVAGFLDHLMALLPFEPPYFEAEGLATTFVGHPVVEGLMEHGDGEGFRRAHQIPAGAPVVCVLPGSRHTETGRLLPVFGRTLGLIKERHPDLHAIVPTVDTVADEVTAAAAAWPVPAVVSGDVSEKAAAFAAADVALAASGTVALELAVAGIPAVIGYRVHPLTSWLARRLVRGPFVSLVNVILERQVMPEFLLNDCTPDKLAAAVGALLVDEAARAGQRAAGADALARLGGGGMVPSSRAAEVVLKVIDGD